MAQVEVEVEQLQDPEPERTPGLVRRWVGHVAWGVGLLMVVALAASLAGRLAWWLDLITHFRPQLAVGLFAFAVAGVFVLKPVKWMVLLASAGVAVATLPLPGGEPDVAGEQRLTVVHANLSRGESDFTKFANWVNQSPADLVLVQEVTPQTLPALQQLLPEFEMVASEPRWDTRGVAALARKDQVASGAIIRNGMDADRPVAQVLTRLDTRPVAVMSFHTTRPTTSYLYEVQRDAYQSAAGWGNAYAALGFERVVIGDYNASTYSALPGRLKKLANLRDARGDLAMVGTYPADLPAPLRIATDNALISRGLTQTELEVGPDIGSDHRPIRVTLAASDTPTAAQQSATPAAAWPGSSASPPPATVPSTGPADSPGE